MERFEAALRGAFAPHGLGDAAIAFEGGDLRVALVSFAAGATVRQVAGAVLDAARFAEARACDPVLTDIAACVAERGVLRLRFEELPGAAGEPGLPRAEAGEEAEPPAGQAAAAPSMADSVRRSAP